MPHFDRLKDMYLRTFYHSPVRHLGCRYFAKFSHINPEDGSANMVDVSSKAHTKRTATASALMHLGLDVTQAISENNIQKGGVLSVARIAGINGAKQTSQLIPLCHNIMLSKVDINFVLCNEKLQITSTVSSVGPTGVEMEALTAVSVAALTVYDMCKSMSKSLVIEAVQLESKNGGKSGAFYRET